MAFYGIHSATIKRASWPQLIRFGIWLGIADARARTREMLEALIVARLKADEEARS